jgi:choline dehydrogenase-like flavoprotein
MALTRGAGGPDAVSAHYELDAAERARIRAGTRHARAALVRLRCVPFATIDPGHGSSIHYAGGLSMTDDEANALGTGRNGRLHAAPGVYVADSANWAFLPSKGPTLTMMANARRVAGEVAHGLVTEAA